MKNIPGKVVWGVLLILIGVLFLLQELNVVGDAFDYLWVILMAAAGAAFLYVFASRKEQWWAVIPGLTLLGLSLVAANDLLNLVPGGDLGGAVFLGSIGLAFWLVYARQPDQWWAIIPGGVMLTLALVAGLDPLVDSDGGIFFLGLAATFTLVAVLTGSSADTRWAFIPAAVLGVLGLSLMVSLDWELINIIWPAALIVVGGYLLVRNIL